MAKRQKDKVRVPTEGGGELTAQPFAGLGLSLGDALPRGPIAAASEEASAPVDSGSAELPWGKILLRREKKGRGGKVVTLVEGVPGPAERREALLGELRRELGCGGHLEAEHLVFTGEHVPRLEAALRARGAKTIVRGN